MPERRPSHIEQSRLLTNPIAVETQARAKRPLDVFNISERGPVKPRTREEVQHLKQTIGLIARVFSKNYDMQVYPSADGGWACGVDGAIVETLDQYMHGKIPTLDGVPDEQLRPKKIFYDVKDIEGKMDDAEVLGVVRHEVGHANNTDYKLFFEGQKFALDEGYLPSSYAQGWNSCEDPWVNNREIAGSETVREHMTSLYRKWIPEVEQGINTQPRSHQLGLNIIQYWLTGDSIPTLKDQEVLQLFNGIRPAVDEYFEAPTAAEAQKIFRERIWDAFKVLEKKSAKDEQTKEMMRRMSGSDLGKGSSGELGEGENKDQSMIDKIRQKLGIGGKGKKPTQAGEGDPDLKGEVKKEMQRQEKAAKGRKETLQKQGHPTGEIPDDIDLSDVPKDLLKKIREAIDKLTPEQKNELEKAAREELDKKQAASANKKLPPGIQMKKDPKTGTFQPHMKPGDEKKGEKVKEAVDAFNEAEAKAAEEKAKQEAEAEVKRAAEEAEAKRQQQEREQMAKDGFEPDEIYLYRRFRMLEASMDGQIQNFVRVMDRYLPKKEETEYGGEAGYVGHKLSPRDIVRRAPIQDYRIHLRRQIIESEEPRLYIELLIDNSGSMAGQKMDESLKTAIFLSRVLKRFGIPFAIKFFGDRVDEAMAFGDDYDDPKKHIKPNLVKKGTASGGGTDMASPLTKAVEEMTTAKRKFVGCHGGIFVISDSGANSGPMTGATLGEYIKEKQKTFSIINFLLSNSGGDLAEALSLFGEGNVIAATDFGNLPQEAFKVLRIVLERVLKTFRSV